MATMVAYQAGQAVQFGSSPKTPKKERSGVASSEANGTWGDPEDRYSTLEALERLDGLVDEAWDLHVRHILEDVGLGEAEHGLGPGVGTLPNTSKFSESRTSSKNW